MGFGMLQCGDCGEVQHLLRQNVTSRECCANDLLLRRAAGRRQAAGPPILHEGAKTFVT